MTKAATRKSSRSLIAIQPNPNAIPAQLKYYDPELMNALNSEPFNRARYESARTKAKRLHHLYMKQLAVLRPRMSKRTFARFVDAKVPLFDTNLLEFTFGDSLRDKPSGSRLIRFRTSVQATFLSFDVKTIHTLKYRDINSLRVDVPAQRWFDMGGKDIDSLLADEITAVGRNLMRHTFLFASGATISLVFARVTWDTQRAPR